MDSGLDQIPRCNPFLPGNLPARPYAGKLFQLCLVRIQVGQQHAVTFVGSAPSCNLDLSVIEVDPADVPDLIRGGRLDVALVHEYGNVPSAMGSGIELEPLLDEVVYLASPSTSTTSDTAAIRSHSESRWIVANPGTLCHTMTIRTCQSQGFEPHVAHRVDDFTTVLLLVAAGAGVALVPRLGATDVPPGVVLTALPIGRHTRIAYREGSRFQPAFAAVSAELHRAARRFHTEPHDE